ncbi:cytochrome b N-terminal domain-containing protein [Rathayibacter sp. VKM Ac-2805]|uniref:cytochrome bc1 complex cytochrome b subunit n=1 Tax=Rathayibacter sp. VKM Ac-2805 TaxID=2609258 RepID=UPI00131F4C51|nr:cytochrome b N-terminal domain-containing protein [Rathayibacter sp. VKM Ac-2805]QHC72536.1 ubiquinol-cytochrome c reductase cytochrome b subunit [Rathayibacter sp. VKM Ac-2805]
MPVERRPGRGVRSGVGRLRRSPAGRLLDGALVTARRRRVPLHWTSVWGVVTAASASVFIASGVFLMVVFVPSSDPTVYDGAYAPMRGREMSEAYASTLRIVFDIPGGLLVRQAHHWSMQLLPASIVLQLLTTFFTGGFRRPRRTGWVLLLLLFVVALVGGWSGYGLPDDMLSGTGLQIVQGITLALPVIGAWASGLLFGGAFPGVIIEHLAVIHFLVVPPLLILLLALRAALAWRRQPAQFPAPGRTEENVVGVPLLPTAVLRLGGLFLLVTGVLLLVSATVTVSPVWLYGPSDPGNASAGSQPDWYTGFLDGALRLVPSGWEFVWLGRTWTLYVLVPLAVVGLFLVVVLAYPFLEEWASGDHREHHLLQRPRDTPTRTGIGAAGTTFSAVLWGAGSADVMAHRFQLAFEQIILLEQAALLIGPAAAFALTRSVCSALQRSDRDLLLHGRETGRIVRLPGGEFIEVHEPASAGERWRILAAEQHDDRLAPEHYSS